MSESCFEVDSHSGVKRERSFKLSRKLRIALAKEENAMKRRAMYLASAALGAALVASGSAWAQMANEGSFCSTPVKICELSHASWIGNGCSCRVPGGGRGVP